MGSLANRFKALDEALDVGFANVNNIVDNSVYSLRKDIEDTILGFNFDGLDILNDFIQDAADIINIVTNLPKKIMSQLEKLFDKIVGMFKGLQYSNWGSKILNALDLLSLGGVKNFILESVKAGNVILCNNLGTLLDFMNGFDVPKDIMEGLFFNLIADWMNRVCKPMSRREESRMSIFDVVDTVYPYEGEKLVRDEIVTDFTELMGTYLKFTLYYKEEGKGISSIDTIDSLINAKSESEVFKEITPFKDMISYRGTVDNLNTLVVRNKGGVNVYTDKYIKILNVRGEVNRQVPLAPPNQTKAKFTQTAADALGSNIRSISGFDLDTIPISRLNKMEKQIFEKFPKMIEISNKGEYSFLGFRQFDWNEGRLHEFVNLFTEEEHEYMMGLDPNLNSYRLNGLSATTSEFLRDGTFYDKPKDMRNLEQ